MWSAFSRPSRKSALNCH